MPFAPIDGKATVLSSQHMAEGGLPSVSQMSPWWSRREEDNSLHTHGLLNSPVAGRTDLLNKNVPAGSYVIPADVVSGLGEGNTMAGASVLDRMFHTLPHGIQGSSVHAHMGPPHAPAPFHEPRARGGKTTGQKVPVILAGGEFLIHPDAVKKLGGGDMKRGHEILDHFVLHVRKKTKQTLGKLKGPKK